MEKKFFFWNFHLFLSQFPQFFRGASAINWTLIEGDAEAGLSIFWADDGLDTGPILLQKKCKVDENDTLNTLYKRFLYPAGVAAMAESVELIASGNAPRIVQPEEGASYEPYITTKPELAQIDWSKTQRELHNFIRGNDKVPGAWAILNGEKVSFFGSKLWKPKKLPEDAVEVKVAEVPGGRVLVEDRGLLLPGSDGRWVIVDTVKIGTKTIPASKFGQGADQIQELVFSDEEKVVVEKLKKIWAGILKAQVSGDTDFFESGASSADVTRLVEEIKFNTGAELESGHVSGKIEGIHKNKHFSHWDIIIFVFSSSFLVFPRRSTCHWRSRPGSCDSPRHSS